MDAKIELPNAKLRPKNLNFMNVISGILWLPSQKRLKKDTSTYHLRNFDAKISIRNNEILGWIDFAKFREKSTNIKI